MTKINRFFILLTFLSLAIHVVGQTPAKEVTLSGYILDGDKEPVPFATVKVKDKPWGTTANFKGYYKLTLKPTKDSLTVRFSALGYKAVEQKLNGLQANQHLNIRLPQSDVNIANVTVTASQQNANTMERVDAGKIRLDVSPSGGVESLVGSLQGVSQKNELSSRYSVRGGSYDENMVYVNGVEIYRPLLARTAMQEGLSFINPYMTQSVRFSAGGFDASYADKASSVLAITYKQPKAFEGSVSAGLLGADAYVGWGVNKFSQVLGIRYKTTSSLLSKTDTKAEYAPTYLDAQTYMVYRFNDKTKLSFMGNLSGTNYRFVPKTRETSFGTMDDVKKLKIYFDGKEQDKFFTLFGALTLAVQPKASRKHEFTLSAFQSREEERYDINGEYVLGDVGASDPSFANSITGGGSLGIGSNWEHARNFLNYNVWAANYKATVALSSAHRLEMGAELRFEHVSDHISEWVQRDSMGYSLPRDPNLLKVYRNLFSDHTFDMARTAVYLQDQMQFDTKRGVMMLTPGVRASFQTFTKELLLSPRLVASFRPTEHPELMVRMSTGAYFQSPFYKEIRRIAEDRDGNMFIELNKKVKSQGSALLLLGGDYNFKLMGRRFRFTAEAYFKYLFHINPYIMDNVRLRYYGDNIGKGYATGLDLKLFGEFVPEVDSWITFSIMKTKQTLDGIGSMPLPSAPAYSLNFFFQDYFPGLKRISLTLRAALSGGLPMFNPAKGFSEPAFTGAVYKRADIGLAYDLLKKGDRLLEKRFLSRIKKATLSVDCFNLFDMVNVSGYYWVTDVFRRQYAVPNYLTRRQYNLRLRIDF